MRTKSFFIWFVIIIIGLGVLPPKMHAEEKKNTYILVDVIVKPSMEREFVAAVKEEVAIYSKYGYTYSWTTYSTGDRHYYFAIPIKNHADIDAFYEAGSQVEKKRG
ncbi:hypothetical protein BVY01_01415 [bacterium I07]|nr:hypothetical protein BVY01_01415 [bacterium I07]